MRVKTSKARRRSNKRWFKEAKGNYGGRSRLIETVQETVLRARAFGFVGRKLKKREYRALWIVRVSAACRQRGLGYSEFIHGLKTAGIELNRKTLSELAVHEPEVFDEIVAAARAAG